MQYKIKVLKKGDKVLNVWDNKIAIMRKNGEVDIYSVIFKKDSLPALSSDILTVAYGNETVEVSNKASSSNGIESDDDDDEFVISIKSPKNRG